MSAQLSLGASTKLYFTGHKEDFALNVQILRQEEIEAKPPLVQYGYGCQFLRLDRRSETKLRSFVYSLEAAERKSRV